MRVIDRDGNVLNSGTDFPLGDFDFTYEKPSVAFTLAAAGTVLDITNYAAISAGEYFVTTHRANGSPGRDCSSAPYKVDILDRTVLPVAVLTPFPNTSCDPGFFEGEVTVGVTDATPVPAPVGGFLYDYTWTTAPTAIAATTGSDGDAVGTEPDGDNPSGLAEGTYVLSLRNTSSNCVNTASTMLFKNATPVFTQQVAATDQIYCGNDGKLEVLEVRVVDRDGNAITSNPPDALGFPVGDFEFDWARPLVAFTQTTAGTVLDIVNYAAISAGEYFVTSHRVNGSPGRDCSSAPYKVDILDRTVLPVAVLTPFPNTSCDPAFFEGEIEVRVTDGTSVPGPFVYDYTWTTAPTAIAAVLGNDGDGDGSDADGDNPVLLSEGTYVLSLRNTSSNCVNTASTTLFKNATPVFTQQVAATDQIYCGNDGKLEVLEVRVVDRDGKAITSNPPDPAGFPIGDFEFDWARPLVAFTQITAGTVLDIGNYAAISAGEYFVTSHRVNGSPGKDCSSDPYKIDILDKTVLPVASLTPLANTSCDLVVFEGGIEVRVSDDTAVPGPFTYSYNWTTAPTGILPTAGNNGDGGGADSDNPMGLQEGVYVLSVTNAVSNCQSTSTTEIFKNSTPVLIPLSTAIPQVVCLPSGNILVDEVSITDRSGVTQVANINHFNFQWSRGTVANVVLTTNGVNGPIHGAGGTRLDSLVYPTIGFDTYYIIARRVAGGPGLNCESAPYKIDIEDKRIYPVVTFSSLPNSSCNPIGNPNGTLIAIANELDGIPDNYLFSWVFNSGVLNGNTVQIDSALKSTLRKAENGEYVVTAHNQVTDCPVDASFVLELDQSRSTPNVIDVTTVDPLDCKPSASADVVKVTFGSETNSILYPPNVPPNNSVTGAGLAAYTYRWYAGVANLNSNTVIPGQTSPSIAPNAPGLLPGTYFVKVFDPSTDCESPPKELVINEVDIDYPDVIITQTALDITCTGVGSGQLRATVDNGFTDTNPNYDFHWYPSLDTTGVRINPVSTSTISQLFNGNYSVAVKDLTTGCVSSELYILPDDSPLGTPLISLGGADLTLCVGKDGAVLVRVINMSDQALVDPADPTYVNRNYPFPAYDFTAELSVGKAPAPGPFIMLATLKEGVHEYPVPNTPLVGLDSGWHYVRVLDVNTGCDADTTHYIKDERAYPVIDIIEEQSLTNCENPNGQLSASADNGRVVGYTFDWLSGVDTIPPPNGGSNKLLRQAAGTYTVLVINETSHCPNTKEGIIQDRTNDSKPPAPIIEILSHVTRCGPFDNVWTPNGWLKVSVEGDNDSTDVRYLFNWYDTGDPLPVPPPSPDFVGFEYYNLDAGVSGLPYTVTAKDLISGCVSDAAKAIILPVPVNPEIKLTASPAYCLDTGKPGVGTVQVEITNTETHNSLGQPVFVLLETAEWTNVASGDRVGNGVGVYDLYPGIYKVDLISTEGCTASGQVEVKTEIYEFNGISDNDDGSNDFFVIDCISRFTKEGGAPEDNNVKVFNRSGILVYEVDGYNNIDKVFKGIGENGVYPFGSKLPEGTYFYIIDKRDGSKPIAGYLELDRNEKPN